MCRTAHRATVETAVLDVADRAAFQVYAESVQSSFGRVNMVFNNAGVALGADVVDMSWEDFDRSEEHTSELQSLMRISYAVFCLKKNKKTELKQAKLCNRK